MGRQRVVNPDEWTTEKLVACTPTARLLLFALRSEADDQGIFEWRPTQLKMRLLPGDNVDIDELLTELITHGHLVRYVVEGEVYGLLTDWRQHPRHPSNRYPAPMSEQGPTDVGLESDHGPTDVGPMSDRRRLLGFKGLRVSGFEEASPTEVRPAGEVADDHAESDFKNSGGVPLPAVAGPGSPGIESIDRRQVRHDAWVSMCLREAQRTLAPGEFHDLGLALLEDPVAPWAKTKLEALSRAVKRRRANGGSTPPAQRTMALPIAGGRCEEMPAPRRVRGRGG
jgi:hypothetical protein